MLSFFPVVSFLFPFYFLEIQIQCSFEMQQNFWWQKASLWFHTPFLSDSFMFSLLKHASKKEVTDSRDKDRNTDDSDEGAVTMWWVTNATENVVSAKWLNVAALKGHWILDGWLKEEFGGGGKHKPHRAWRTSFSTLVSVQLHLKASRLNLPAAFIQQEATQLDA